MRLNKHKKLLANKRRTLARSIPQWIYKKTDRKIKNQPVHYSWRSQKLKV